MSAKFYLVWREGGGPPAKQHFVEQEARDEAARLARENPNAKFHIMESKGFFATKIPEVEFTNAFDPQAPITINEEALKSL